MVGKRRKKALHKDFWQEIRKSRARFISIFCIVALGVAFFSGIQAASPDMRLSGDAYYNEASLMDLKVMATLGLTEDDVKAIQSIDGVESAEGAICRLQPVRLPSIQESRSQNISVIWDIL